MTHRCLVFAQQLRQARLDRGWTQRQLSEAVAIPQSHISRIESGLIDVKVSTLVDLGKQLGLDVMLAPRCELEAIVRSMSDDNAGARLRAIQDLIQTPASKPHDGEEL